MRSPRSGTAACRASARTPGTWKERALRAEAERDAAARDRLLDGAGARARSAEVAERALDETPGASLADRAARRSAAPAHRAPAAPARRGRAR